MNFFFISDLLHFITNNFVIAILCFCYFLLLFFYIYKTFNIFIWLSVLVILLLQPELFIV